MIHGNRREFVVRSLLTALFDREFEAGQRLRVEHLAERFEVSVTPVREALVDLKGLGLVELQPNRGAVVLPFGPRQVREICQIRSLLECEATRGASGRIAPFELRALEEGLAALIQKRRSPAWSDETRLLDSQLHELIAERCASERLAHEIDRYAVLFRSLRDARHKRRKARDNYSNMEENAEHLAIVRALAAGEAEKAVSAMALHITKASEALEQDLFETHELHRSSREEFLELPRHANGRRRKSALATSS